MKTDERTLRLIALWSAVLALVMTAAGCATAPRACSKLLDGRERAVLVAERRGGIKLDGDLSDWKGVRFTEVTLTSGLFDPQCPPTKAPADLGFRFATCYDDEAIYVAVEVTDDAVQADSCPPGSVSCPAWDDDAIEVFIDGNHNHAANSRVAGGSELRYGGEFALIANGAASSDYSGYPRTFGRVDTWQGATNWASLQRGGKLVRYEFRISWNVIGRRLKPGDTIGFDISVQDDDDGKGRDHALYFCGLPPRMFLDERGFADLFLKP